MNQFDEPNGDPKKKDFLALSLSEWELKQKAHGGDGDKGLEKVYIYLEG